MNIFSKNNFNILTTEEIFEGQRFAILAMFSSSCSHVEASVQPIPVISRHFQPFPAISSHVQLFQPYPAISCYFQLFPPFSAISRYFQTISDLSSDFRHVQPFAANIQYFPAVSSPFKQYQALSRNFKQFPAISSNCQPFFLLPFVLFYSVKTQHIVYSLLCIYTAIHDKKPVTLLLCF